MYEAKLIYRKTPKLLTTDLSIMFKFKKENISQYTKNRIRARMDYHRAFFNGEIPTTIRGYLEKKEKYIFSRDSNKELFNKENSKGKLISLTIKTSPFKLRLKINAHVIGKTSLEEILNPEKLEKFMISGGRR